MNELQKRFQAHRFAHDKECKFEKQIKGFDFNGTEIILRDDDYEVSASLTMRYCPYCGFDIDASVAQMLIIKQREKELIEASPIKVGDLVWIKRPNNSYWKGVGFKQKVEEISYQQSSDRLLYQSYNNGFMSCAIEDIEPYTNQPVCNA